MPGKEASLQFVDRETVRLVIRDHQENPFAEWTAGEGALRGVVLWQRTEVLLGNLDRHLESFLELLPCFLARLELRLERFLPCLELTKKPLDSARRGLQKFAISSIHLDLLHEVAPNGFLELCCNLDLSKVRVPVRTQVVVHAIDGSHEPARLSFAQPQEMIFCLFRGERDGHISLLERTAVRDHSSQGSVELFDRLRLSKVPRIASEQIVDGDLPKRIPESRKSHERHTDLGQETFGPKRERSQSIEVVEARPSVSRIRLDLVLGEPFLEPLNLVLEVDQVQCHGGLDRLLNEIHCCRHFRFVSSSLRKQI